MQVDVQNGEDTPGGIWMRREAKWLKIEVEFKMLI